MTEQHSEHDGAPEIEEEVAVVFASKVPQYGVKKKSRKFFSRFMQRIGRRGGSKDIDLKVTNYLDQNQEILKAYIMKSVSENQLQCWLEKKRSLEHQKSSSDHGQSPFRKKETPQDFFMNVEKKLNLNRDELSSIQDLVYHIKSAVTVDAYRTYKIDVSNDSNVVKRFVTDTSNNTIFYEVDDDTSKFVEGVAKTLKCLRLSRGEDSGFRSTSSTLFNSLGTKNEKEEHCFLYQPIRTIENKYVIEMRRLKDQFDEKDEELCTNIAVAFYYCNLYIAKQRESDTSGVLLDVVKTIFEDMVSLDQRIESILKLAQKLVNADIALFLLCNNNFEFESTVFDLKFDQGPDKNVIQNETKTPIIRVEAGCVASSGKILNIENEHADVRFNSKVDMVTGYMTKSILRMPIKVQGKVIGEVEMLKKNDLVFNHEDEIAFEKFCVFFELALQNAKLYNKIQRNEERYKVALEVLTYHNTCKDREVQEVESCVLSINLNNFYLDPYKLDELQKCKAAIKMFDILFDMSKFDSTAVTKFIFTVKKNYRNTLPYHNFDHAWSVAHSMYVILKNDNEERFNYKEKLALFVACLCHDLDHRGYNNDYLKETEAPLAAMFSKSPLEHHHFSITEIILQLDGHNIFSNLSSEDYKQVIEYIKKCILATDLSSFASNLGELKLIFDNSTDQPSFDWAIPRNRDLAMALTMTAADLSASAKPWGIQNRTVDVIFKEFYLQGDELKKADKTPIPMMDRNKPEEKPTSQVAFLESICVPCYKMLYQIFPHTEPMYDMVMENLERWLSLANMPKN